MRAATKTTMKSMNKNIKKRSIKNIYSIIPVAIPSLPLCSLISFKFFLILQGFPCFFYALMIKYTCRSIGLFHLLEEIMYIECFTNNAKPYLRLVQSVRVTNKAGKKLPQKQVILNLGPLDRFDDGQPDYVECCGQAFL